MQAMTTKNGNSGDKCDWCGKPIEKNVTWQRFCSNRGKCHGAYWKAFFKKAREMMDRTTIKKKGR